MEFHMKNYSKQGHSYGIYEKVYAIALKRIMLFSHLLPRWRNIILYSVGMTGSRAPSPAILVIGILCGQLIPKLSVPLTFPSNLSFSALSCQQNQA